MRRVILIHAIHYLVMELPAEHSCYALVRKHFCRLAGWHGCFFLIEAEIKLCAIIHVINIIFITQKIYQMPFIQI